MLITKQNNNAILEQLEKIGIDINKEHIYFYCQLLH